MQKICFVVIAMVAFVLGNHDIGYADGGRGGGHFDVDLWVGPSWGPGWGAGYPYYYYEPPVIIQKAPEIYVEPQPQVQEQHYWYYCQNPQGYYPYVKRCPEGWMKVVPSPPPEGSE